MKVAVLTLTATLTNKQAKFIKEHGWGCEDLNEPFVRMQGPAGLIEFKANTESFKIKEIEK